MSWPLPELAHVPQVAAGAGPAPLHLDADELSFWRRERTGRIYRHDQAIWDAAEQLRKVVRARAGVAVVDAVLAGDRGRAETLAELVVDWHGTWQQLSEAVDALCRTDRDQSAPARRQPFTARHLPATRQGGRQAR